MFERYFNKLKEELLIRNHSPRTYNTYRICILKFLEWTGKTDPETLTLYDARNYILHMRLDRGFTTQYCNAINASIRFFYKFVLHFVWNEEIVPRMINDTKQPEVLSLKEIELMIDTAQNVRNKAIISLLYSSGLRLNELCNLSLKDIYMSTMQVHVRNSKNHGEHWTILSHRSLDLLIEYWNSYKVYRDYLFVSSYEKHDKLSKSCVYRIIKKIGKEAGIEHVHPHVFRHSFASHMIEQGVPIEHVQAMMGHRSPSSTYRYIHVTNKAFMGIHSPLDHFSASSKDGDKRNE